MSETIESIFGITLAAFVALFAIATSPKKPASIPRLEVVKSTATPAVQGETTPDAPMSDATASEHEAVSTLAVSYESHAVEADSPERRPANAVTAAPYACSGGACAMPRTYHYQRRRAAFLPRRR